MVSEECRCSCLPIIREGSGRLWDHEMVKQSICLARMIHITKGFGLNKEPGDENLERETEELGKETNTQLLLSGVNHKEGVHSFPNVAELLSGGIEPHDIAPTCFSRTVTW